MPHSSQSVAGELVRLGWMLFGFNGILLGAWLIAQQPQWTLGWRDAAFWFAVLLAAACRYFDIAKFGGQTAGGHPATMLHLRRYLLGLALSTSAVWVMAHSVDL